MRAAKGAIVLTASSLSFLTMGYVTNVILGRLLGPGEYGVYSVLIALMTAFNVMQISGVPQSLSRLVAAKPEQAKSYLGSALAVQLALMLGLMAIFFCLAPVFGHIFDDKRISEYAMLLALIFPVYGAYVVFSGYNNGLHHFGRQSIGLTSYSLGKFCLILGLGILYGLKGAVIGFILSPILGLVSTISRFTKPKMEYAKKLIKGSLPLILFAILYTGILSADLFIVKATQINKAAAGYYAASQNIAQALLFGFSAFGQVLFPVISRLTSQNKNSEISEILSHASRYLVLMLLPIAGLFIGGANELVNLLFGGEYTSSISSLRILVMGYVFLTLFSVFSSIFNGAGKARLSIKISTLALSIQIPTCFILVSTYGVNGAALATFIAAFISSCLVGFCAYRYFNIHLPLLSALRGLIGAIVVALLSWYVKPPFAIISLWWLALGLLYVLWLIMSGEVSRRDIVVAKQILRSRQHHD